ncbi:MAG: right-handed parallel beta-helix repeat-containing protein [Desulfobaccales bacterium]|nr:right-handed parallel beta-helix repeat-containing protein [Desulfobaccales bacterium]
MKRSGLWLLALLGIVVMSTQALGGDWTEGQFLYKPGMGARGEQEKAKFEAGLDRVADRLVKTIWVGDPNYGPTLPAAVNDIGSAEANLHVPPGIWNIAADLTIPANVNLKPERGATLSVATGKTLTINGELDAGHYQIFTWTGTGAVSFTSQRKIKTAWFGNTAAGINKALTSTPTNTPVVCELPGGTIALGTTSIVMEGAGQTLQGQGNNFAGSYTYGTRLNYLGTSYAIIVGKVGTFTTHATLKDFTLDGGVGSVKTGAKGIRLGFVDPGWARYPCMENVTVRLFTGNGVDVYGSGYGIFRRCQFSYNGGAGMLVGPTPLTTEGGNVNRVESCSFSYNDQEGILFKNGGDWSFVSNDLQGNGYEGFKVLGYASGGVNNLLIESNWFEGNQVDASRTDGYFHLLAPNSYPDLITIRNNNFRGVTNPWNGTTGNKMMSVVGKAVIGPNSYGSFGMGTNREIEAITRANPAQVTLTGHGWATNDYVLLYPITQTGGWSVRLSGVSFKITKVDDDNFTIDCDTTACTDAFSPSSTQKTRKINVPRPWNYCGGGVLHLIGEDLDKWSYYQHTKVIGDFGGWCYADYVVRTTRTTGEEALYEHIINGGTLAGNGAIISDEIQERPRFIKGSRLGRLHIRAEGTKTGTGGNKTIKLYWGTQAIATIGPANNTNSWVIDAWVQMTDATAQVINATTLDASTLAATRTAGTQNLVNDCKVYVTGLAATAGDTITCHSLSIMPQ